LLREEIFGPILPVIGYDTLDEVAEYINARERPLALYAFSKDSQPAKRVFWIGRSRGA
jgi:acyl-CoA reductase-like NAD-dependent aldehyde dehydrogenase